MAGKDEAPSRSTKAPQAVSAVPEPDAEESSSVSDSEGDLEGMHGLQGFEDVLVGSPSLLRCLDVLLVRMLLTFLLFWNGNLSPPTGTSCIGADNN